MDSYRVEKRAAIRIQLPDEERLIDPVPTGEAGGLFEPEIDRLSNILKTSTTSSAALSAATRTRSST